MPNVRRAVVVSAAAAVVVAVAGCTGSSSPAPTGSSTWPGGSTTTTSTPSTTTSSSTTTATPDLATRFPKTKAGAEGFVRAYVDALTQAFRTANASLISEYVDADCSACDKWISDISTLKARNQHFVGDLVKLVEVNQISSSGNGVIVQALIDVPEAKFVDTGGRTTSLRTSEPRAPFYFRLLYADHWRVVKAAAA